MMETLKNIKAAIVLYKRTVWPQIGLFLLAFIGVAAYVHDSYAMMTGLYVFMAGWIVFEWGVASTMEKGEG